MNKQEILELTIDENPSIDFDDVSIEMCDTFMAIFYLNKIQELGLIETDINSLTNRGFDVAMTLYENGWKVSDEELTVILGVLFDEPIMPTHPLLIFCSKFRDDGFDSIKSDIERLKKVKEN
jgi:hypothetical protein